MWVQCSGDVVLTDQDGAPLCLEEDEETPALWVHSQAEFSFEEVDLEVAGTVFAYGFVIVGTAWAIGYGARVLLDMIRR